MPLLPGIRFPPIYTSLPVPRTSRFLPDDYDATLPVSVIAGQALYPVLTVAGLRAAGVRVRLIAFEGETREDLYDSFPDSERVMLKVGQLGHMLKAIRDFGSGYAMMVGQITPRRLFKGLHPDAKALLLMAKLKEKNAETIFGAISDEVEKGGARMIDARAFLDDHIADPGMMTKGRFPEDRETLAHGIRIARGSAALDIGQSVVVRKGTVIAAEAFEGTDAMLRRAGELRTDGLVFVKTTKPQQDFRFDVPVFGMRTLEAMRAAGIRVAALEAGSVLVLEKAKVIATAEAGGIALYGWGEGDAE